MVTLRQNWGEERVYYFDEQRQLVSIPARWTSALAADPAVAVSAGRSRFRLEDLLELCRLIGDLQTGKQESRQGGGRGGA